MITADDLLRQPLTDPTSIYRYRDGLYAADLLTVAIAHLNLFSWLNEHPVDQAGLCQGLGLEPRPTDVMLTLLVAMGLLQGRNEVLSLTDLAREHLLPDSPWNIGPYFASLKDRPVCRDMLTALRTGRPANWGSLEKEKAWAQAMEDPAFASHFTAGMDCRGILLGPALAKGLNVGNHHRVLDIAGGSGIYACALVARHPQLRATVFEKSPVDKIAAQSIASRGFADQVAVHCGDMFADPFPTGCDIHLFSNVLHDWGESRVRILLGKSFAALPPGGMVLIHGAHINADKTGPLPAAAYSALLMTITEGKCYSERELATYLTQCGFKNVGGFATAADRSAVVAYKS